MSGGGVWFFLILHRTIFSIHIGKAFTLVSILLSVAGIGENSNSNGKTSCELHRSQKATLNFKGT